MAKINKDFDPDKYYRWKIGTVKVKYFPMILFIAISTMTFSVVAGFIVLILAGIGVLVLPDKVLEIVATGTVGAVGTAMLVVYRFFFAKK